MRLLSVMSAIAATAVVAAPVTINIDGALPDGGDCNTIGLWDGSNICNVQDLDLDPDSTLTIENATLLLGGTLVNLGEIAIGLDTRLEVEDFGRLDNRGNLANQGVLFAWGSVDNSGFIDNSGELFVWPPMHNDSSGSIYNSGSLSFEFGFENSGTLISDGGLWINNGAINNAQTGVVVSNGGLFSSAQTQINNLGTWDNSDWWYGISVAINNSGTLNNHHTISLCDDYYEGTLINTGTINNFGMLFNCGVIDNLATIHNSGNIGGNVSIVGTVDNSGTLLNCGLVTGILTGNPPVADLDVDGDMFCDVADCAPTDSGTWQVPGEAKTLRLSRTEGTLNETTLEWNPPQAPGGTNVVYDVVSSSEPDGFLFELFTGCIEVGDGSDMTANEPFVPDPGFASFYLVRPANSCGKGSSGVGSNDVPRAVLDCP